MPSSRDVAMGRVAARILTNGDRVVTVIPAAQVNQLTLRQKIAHVAQLKLPPIDAATARQMGYGEDEIAEAFPAAPRAHCPECGDSGTLLIQTLSGRTAAISCPFCPRSV